MSRRSKQKGAALLIVLLLAATLSFLALATMERTTTAASRAVNVNARGEALWRAFAVETLSLAAVDDAVARSNGRMSLDDPWAASPVELPFDGGGARVVFADATACFNLNSLGAENNEAAAAEFVRLSESAGVSSFDATALADAIADWIDADGARRPQGAEDEYYSILPSPYRTANQPFASVTELRAIRGATREVYAALKPYLCALPGTGPSPLNVNMLEERHAPVLAAALGDGASVQAAKDVIAARPPGGYATVDAFMGTPQVSALGASQGQSRFAVTSAYVVARAEIVYDTALLEMTSEIAVQNGGSSVIARRIGAEE
ncbi:MAG: type II secretion system minor pseudopilin GspK [Parvularculaceae bacterium]